MKTVQQHRIICCVYLASLLGGLGAMSSYGQFTFDSGSDGSYGPMNITSNTTLALPPDGKFKCTTITIGPNRTLRFTPNALNTPVYLLATSNVTINGTIDVGGSLGNATLGGSGGPGGFAGGNPGNTALLAGDGNGPGAGHGVQASASAYVGSAGYGTAGSGFYATTNDGKAYGSPLLVPLVGGSGGGGTASDFGGAGGGGAILIVANTRIDLQGTISSSSPDMNPGYLHAYGFGSGGAIRLVAPVVGGRGNLKVNDGFDVYNGNPSGGAGRIRIDCMDRRELAFNFSPSFSTASLGANMVVFPANPAHLDITQAAGTSIPVGTNSAVFFYLPQGSSTNQTVTVQASNFGANLPIRVVLTPDHGPGRSYDSQIDNSTVNPASVTVPVVVPVNVQVQVNAWTR
jgi:hypothetical protein